jgi:ribonuclease Z
VLREKRALLFDLGYTGRLKPNDIQKITDVFVTHTHIDHFIGFDSLLRALLRRETPLRIFGPSNITECIEGKLRGYTWNLIKEYPLKIEVFGINENHISHTGFYAENCFNRTDYGEKPFDGTVLKEGYFEVKAERLMHQIPCLCFSLKEDFHINIDKAALNRLALPVGPWLSEFKRAVRENAADNTEFKISGRIYTKKELIEIAMITEGQKISYVVDSSIDEENIRKIITLVKDSDTLYCEAYFLEEDRERAIERHHLTAKTAGMIAREAGVKNLVVMHFSPKYRECPEAPEKEAMMEYRKE